MKKNVKILSAILVVILLLSGCITNSNANIYDNKEMIAKEYNRYYMIKSTQNVDGNGLSGSADLLEGMLTVWKFNAAENTDINIAYQIKLSSGKAKLVLISPDNTLTTLVECTSDSDIEQISTDTIQIEKGKNRIKLIGAKDTKIDYEIFIDKGHLVPSE